MPFRRGFPLLTGMSSGLIAAATGFNPLDYPFAEEYYDARTPALTVANGGNVNPWMDLSGHSPTRDMTPYNPGVPDNPPVMRKSPSVLVSPQGLPLVDYNGVDQSGATGTINPMPVLTRGYSYHFYGNWTGGNGVVWNDDTGQRPQLLLNTGAGTVGFRDTAATRTVAGGVTGFHTYSWVFDLGGTCSIYRDGTLLGTQPWVIAYNLSASTIVAVNQVGNAHCPVRLGFGLWYSDSHSAATVAAFSGWASRVWGY